MHASFITTFFLATVASVSALSLADLDPIPSNTVTPGCETAYAKEITECPDASDFRAKKACSSECQAALTTFSKDTSLVCRQAFVSPDSLLRRLLDGGLVSTLCPVSSSSSSTAFASTTATSTSTSISIASTSTSAYATSASTSGSSSSTAASSSSSTAASFSSSTTASSSASTAEVTKIKTDSITSTATPTPSTVSFSGFLTITTSAAAEAGVPTGLAIDESTEPTVSNEISALAVEETSSSASATSTSGSAQTSSTASGNGSPFESSAETTTSGVNAAGTLKAVWTTIMAGATVALVAVLL